MTERQIEGTHRSNSAFTGDAWSDIASQAYNPKHATTFKALNSKPGTDTPPPSLADQIRQEFQEAAGLIDPRAGTRLYPRPGAPGVRDDE